MSTARRSICTALACAALLAAGAQGASAATFYVSPAGNDGNPCTQPGAPCLTIKQAILDAATASEASTVVLAPGTYKETVRVNKPGDEGLTILGSGSASVIEGAAEATEPTVTLALKRGSARLANLLIATPPKDSHQALASEENTVLEGVGVFVADEGEAIGVEQDEVGTLTLQGSSVTMEPGSTGAAVSAERGNVVLSGATIAVAAGSEADGVRAGTGGVSIVNSNFSLAGAEAGTALFDFGGPVSLANDTISQGGASPAVFLARPTEVSFDGVAIAMSNSTNGAPAVQQELGTATYAGLSVSGSWRGSALALESPNVTLRDSHLVQGTSGSEKVEVPAIQYSSVNEGPGLFVQRSVVQSPQLGNVVLAAEDANVTLDSSAILGAGRAIELENTLPRPKLLTVSASTIDAGVSGFADEKDHDIRVVGKEGAVATANVVASILVEPGQAEGEHSSISCLYSDVPNQAQAASASKGAINCATGLNGDTSTPPSVLFAAPTISLGLAPGTAAIDSVPAGAIQLPFGLTPSATDLAGAPRVVDGNSDCIAVQDRGALELQGHSAPCPPPPPVKGAITGLTLSPSAFAAAPKGPTIAKAKYGTLITWKDSQEATATFTIVAGEPGRRQGKSCRKPSKKNRKGRHCTRLVALGSFTHADVAGADALRFTGRLHGARLAKGAYRLEAVPRDAAGAGPTVLRSFRIK